MVHAPESKTHFSLPTAADLSFIAVHASGWLELFPIALLLVL